MQEVFKKKNARLMLCRFKDIRHIFKGYHYKEDAMGGGISNCFAMIYNGKLTGGSVLGLPRHSKKYPNTIDIRRMACVDESPKNSESWFLGSIIKWIGSNTDFNFVLSYSDKTVNHEGTIYKASNFKMIGETTPTKYINWEGKIYHPRSLSINRPYSKRLNDAIEKGYAMIHTGLPKKIWIFEITKKQKRKNISISVFDNKYLFGDLFTQL